MITKIQFQKDARVLAADGRQVGSLERVVVNPNSNVLTNIVVRTGTLIKHKEKVVPIGFVAETAQKLVVLREEAGELESLPPFEERHLVEATNDPGLPSQKPPSVVYGYPGPGPLIAQPAGEQLVTQVDQNIPEGTVAVKEGAKVITEDGKHVGNVEQVLADPASNQVTHFIISSGLLTKVLKLIPIKWVKTVYESTIRLRVPQSSLEELAETPATK